MRRFGRPSHVPIDRQASRDIPERWLRRRCSESASGGERPDEPSVCVGLVVLNPNRLREAKALSQDRRDEALRRQVQAVVRAQVFRCRGRGSRYTEASAKRPILSMSLKDAASLKGRVK